MTTSGVHPIGEPAPRGLSAFPPDPKGLAPRPLGASGLAAPPIAFGGWAIGGGWGSPVPPSEARLMIARALELGVRLFDTAPTYGNGTSESLFGEVLGARRDDVLVATKCGPHDDPRVSLEASLRRLRTDRVDLFQLHEVPREPGALAQRLEAMRALLERGLARALGICNATAADVARALELAPLATVQHQYNLLDRDGEHELLPLLRARGVGFLAYRPLASGVLTGKYGAPPRFDADDHRSRIYWFAGHEFDRRHRVALHLAVLARERGLTTAQLALGWVLAQPGVTVALAGARSVQQVEENVAAALRPLSVGDVSAIDAVTGAIYAPRALRRDVRVSRAADARGEFAVSTTRAMTSDVAAPPLAVGEREAYVMTRLDGRTPYAEIAAGWRPADGRRLLTAQVVLLVDQLADLGLLEDAHD